jgi:hypothetical protein
MTGLSCLSITVSHASLDVLERLAYSREDLARRLTSIQPCGRCPGYGWSTWPTFDPMG